MNLYEELGVKPSATQAQIKAAYRKKSKEHHPDRANGNSDKMAGINQAYETLSDPVRRKKYDEGGGTDPIKSREQRIRELFISAINHVVTDEGNIVTNIRRELTKAQRGGKEAQKDSKKTVASLEKRIAAVKCTGEDNLIGDVLAAKILEGRKHIEMVDGELAVLADVLKMLDSYESSEKDAPEKEEMPEELQGLLEALAGKRRR